MRGVENIPTEHIVSTPADKQGVVHDDVDDRLLYGDSSSPVILLACPQQFRLSEMTKLARYIAGALGHQIDGKPRTKYDGVLSEVNGGGNGTKFAYPWLQFAASSRIITKYYYADVEIWVCTPASLSSDEPNDIVDVSEKNTHDLDRDGEPKEYMLGKSCGEWSSRFTGILDRTEAVVLTVFDEDEMVQSSRERAWIDRRKAADKNTTTRKNSENSNVKARAAWGIDFFNSILSKDSHERGKTNGGREKREDEEEDEFGKRATELMESIGVKLLLRIASQCPPTSPVSRITNQDSSIQQDVLEEWASKKLIEIVQIQGVDEVLRNGGGSKEGFTPNESNDTQNYNEGNATGFQRGCGDSGNVGRRLLYGSDDSSGRDRLIESLQCHLWTSMVRLLEGPTESRSETLLSEDIKRPRYRNIERVVGIDADGTISGLNGQKGGKDLDTSFSSHLEISDDSKTRSRQCDTLGDSHLDEYSQTTSSTLSGLSSSTEILLDCQRNRNENNKVDGLSDCGTKRDRKGLSQEQAGDESFEDLEDLDTFIRQVREMRESGKMMGDAERREKAATLVTELYKRFARSSKKGSKNASKQNESSAPDGAPDGAPNSHLSSSSDSSEDNESESSEAAGIQNKE